MGQVQINNLYNANVYAAGNSFMGKAEEVTLPAVKVKTRDVKALGLISDVELPAGIEKMTGKIKWNSIYTEVIQQFADPFTPVDIQIRSSLENWIAGGRQAQLPVVVFLRVLNKDLVSGLNIKQNDNPDQESEFSCQYFRLEVDGVPVIEFDPFNNILFNSDTDLLAKWRANLGQ
jgi:P2 family phage contractile tail tube protein